MIEPMAKAFVAAREEQREELLAALRSLGVLHLVPAKAFEAEGDDGRLTRALTDTRQALQALRDIEPEGAVPPGTVREIVGEVLDLQRRTREARSRLVALQREAREAATWGRVTKERLDELEERGVPIRVVVVPDAHLVELPGFPASAIPVQALGNERTLVICVGDVEAPLPPRATLLSPPERPLQDIEDEIAGLRAEEAAAPARLARLAHRRPDLAKSLVTLEDQANLRHALHTGLRADHLFGVQGWLPAARAASLADELWAADITAAVQVREPEAGERPPTLVRYPRFLRPIRSLFDLLGVRPGYDEADLTAFFLVAVPLFAGMLIADAGYGLVFLLLAVYGFRRMRRKIGTDALELVMMFGVAALVWGAISGSWFGVTPAGMERAGGWIGALGGALAHLQLIRGSEQVARDTLIKVCFLLGSTHLILAHLSRVVMLAPDASALADLGWCGILGAMLGVIWDLFFRESPLPPAVIHLLFGAGGVGFLLVAFFSAPSPNPLVRVAKGIGGGLFPLIGAFGDTLSYIRLAAVGLASFYLAVAINTLAGQAATAGTWLAGLPILLVGHSLNMTLALVAILAHGVRLNLLEFSSHSGLQWAGYPYRPFTARAAGEQ